ncbi:MAG: hypothetical protein U0935_11575 [Pirellulales bacterium]
MPWNRRRDLIDHSTVGLYHCFSRCVRRSFLLGTELGGLDISHRQDWVRQRLEALASIFSVDVCDHTVMDNHLHVILRNRPEVVHGWSNEEVARRWLRLSRRSARAAAGAGEEAAWPLLRDKKRMAELRRRLSNISWFMLMLNEPLARAANAEDDVSGHFSASDWGAWLKNNEEALLASLYVNLNPVRAGLALTPEDSRYTAACDRIEDRQEEQALRERRAGSEFNLKEQPTRRCSG